MAAIGHGRAVLEHIAWELAFRVDAPCGTAEDPFYFQSCMRVLLGYDGPVISPEDPSRVPSAMTSGFVRDPLAEPALTVAARRRPMAERLELALSWNAVAAELRAGLKAATSQTNRGQ